MKCAEQVRNVYLQAQMWKAIYCYIISTKMYACATPRLVGCVSIRLASLHYRQPCDSVRASSHMSINVTFPCHEDSTAHICSFHATSNFPDIITICASTIVLSGPNNQMFAASALRGLRFFQILRWATDSTDNAGRHICLEKPPFDLNFGCSAILPGQ